VLIWLADHKDVNSSDFIAVGSCLIIPVIAFIYVRVVGKIMRGAGVPPIAEEISSLKLPERGMPASVEEPVELRKAA
jgi:hypothetical protein